MIEVTRFEARLLTILRAILRVGPVEPAMHFVVDKVVPPNGLGPEVLGVICTDLAQGCVQYLAKADGWRSQRFMKGDQPVTGRLWQRVPLDDRKLSFSRHAIEFLIWLAAHDPRTPKRWVPDFNELTIADQLLLYLAYDLFRDSEIGPPWRDWSAFARNGLCRLAYADDFIGQSAHPPEFAEWTIGLGSAILESLQRPLSERWIAMERSKRHVADWNQMKGIGTAQELTLDLFASAIDAAKRWDLARFLVNGAGQLCTPALRAVDLVGGLPNNTSLRLAKRYEVHERAGALLKFVGRLAARAAAARQTGYMDEGYAAAQLYLSDWESAGGESAAAVARATLAELVPTATEDAS